MATPDVTQLLKDIESGKRESFDRLLSKVYDELKKMAHGKLRGERSNMTLNTTGLVHEAYIRMSKYQDMNWKNRAYFFGAASQTMRRILVDHARAKVTHKRSGEKVSLTQAEGSAMGTTDVSLGRLLEIDDALSKMGKTNPRWVQVVECRFFTGLNIEETAEALGISMSTVKDDWRMARAWLKVEMK